MGKIDKRLLSILKKVKRSLNKSATYKNENVGKAAYSLEKILDEIPDDMSGLIDILGLMHKGLRDLQDASQGRGKNIAKAIMNIATVLEQVFTGIPDNGSLEKAKRKLGDLLYEGLSIHESKVSKNGAGSSEIKYTLNDIAAQLVQIEPTNIENWKQLQEMLSAVNRDISHPPSVLKIVEETLKKVDKIIDGNGVNPSSALHEINNMIDTAIDVMDIEIQPDRDEKSEEDLVFSKNGVDSEQRQFDYLPADVDTVLLEDFIHENQELILDAEAALLSLELDPDNMECVKTVFRAFHNIKGTASFLTLMLISDLAHRAETLINEMLEQKVRCKGIYADLVLRSIDMLKELIYVVQETKPGEAVAKPAGYNELIQCLCAPETTEAMSTAIKNADSSFRLGDILVAQGKVKRDEVEEISAEKGDEPLGLKLVRSKSASLTDVARALRTQQRISGLNQITESSVRVRTDRLDRLIDTIGELVISHSMVAQDTVVRNSGDYDFLKKVTHTGKIVRSLQDLSMSMRMVPLKSTFHKMTRLTRDLVRKSSKQLNFITVGEDTEIDRNMVELIKDPLVHLIRNAVDHGIETPEIRRKNGKRPQGTLRLSASHSGGSVVVELEDDGRGLDKKKITERALIKGLLDKSKNLSETEIYNLIFESGFSTAEKVTDMSGRGVGLDVVKKGVESLHGRIDINSKPGEGCTFSIRLPLTMAITDGMLIKVGGQRYIIPTVNIRQSFRPTWDMISTVIGKGEAVLFRDTLMPVFRLYQLFNIPDAINDPTKGLLVIIEDAGNQCALLVDELLGQQQVVAKSLGDGVDKISGISGGAVLGNGCVGLIVDTAGVIALARQASSV